MIERKPQDGSIHTEPGTASKRHLTERTPYKGSVPGPTATISPTQRDLHVLAVDEHGRMNWQKASGYNTRSKVEAAISCYKRVIGDTLKSRHDTRRATEVAIALKSLNRMNQLGRTIFTRIA